MTDLQTRFIEAVRMLALTSRATGLPISGEQLEKLLALYDQEGEW